MKIYYFDKIVYREDYSFLKGELYINKVLKGNLFYFILDLYFKNIIILKQEGMMKDE